MVSRVPDYFEGEFIGAVVTGIGFSEKDKEPFVKIKYNVGKETFVYTTHQWFLKRYKKGEKVTIIYDHSNPSVSSLYAFIGYWIKWPELLFTAGFFVLLFGSAAAITGKNSNELIDPEELKLKRKYDN
jgi:hypothetical protein